MASIIKTDNIQKVSDDSNIIKKCGSTTTVGSGAGNTITVDGATVTLGRCGGTVNLASGATQTGFGRTGTVDWCTTAKTSPFTAASGDGFFVDTSSGAVTVTLPASPSAGDIVSIKDYAATFSVNNLTVGRNSSKIGGLCKDAILNTDGDSITLIYVDGTQGWLNVQTDDTVQGAAYVTATGGTIVTNGDFKTHIFTADGCFAVSCGGNPLGSNTVDYFVVAGGGSGTPGTSGGGGAGGFRISSSAPGCNSPLNTPGGLSVSAQTYPISVGAGGANPDTNGSNSVFSSITSAGGGRQKANGGSGGGGMGNDVEGPTSTYSPGGSGNTPPVSPPQGNDGGDGNRSPSSPINRHGGGGGGAGAVGDRGEASPGTGDGGIGSFIADPFIGPTAPSYGEGGPVSNTRYFAGGGGGGLDSRGASGPGTGGVGGGGDGGNPGGAGTANTGGGAGGTAGPGGTGGAGGSGIVMIRYKFQN